jgi:hypothetical protein
MDSGKLWSPKKEPTVRWLVRTACKLLLQGHYIYWITFVEYFSSIRCGSSTPPRFRPSQPKPPLHINFTPHTGHKTLKHPDTNNRAPKNFDHFNRNERRPSARRGSLTTASFLTGGLTEHMESFGSTFQPDLPLPGLKSLVRDPGRRDPAGLG